MDLADINLVNFALAALTIAFGGICLVSPNYALDALSLRTTGRTDGKSELRAASGGAFVVMSIVAIVWCHPIAWTMLGVHYAGAGLGRIVSIALDGSGSPKIWMFFVIEAAFAAWLIGANAPW